MKNVLLVIFLFFSCHHEKKSNDKTETQLLNSILKTKHYVVGKRYDALSLHYRGKPFHVIGLSVDSLEKSGFSFRGEPNGEFSEFESEIFSDYIGLADENLQVISNRSLSVNGTAYFSAIFGRKDIFTFKASWLIIKDVTDATKPIIADSITKKIFPILKGKLKIENGWTYQLKSKDFIEEFEVISPKTNGSAFWTFNYKVKIR
jgi:hypothetical protein